MGAFWDFLAVSTAVVFSTAIAVPFAGVLVRLRANYNPKSLQLDPEDGVQPHTGPVVTGYLAMFARVYRLEGWAGLYKGFMPTFLSTIFLSTVILFAFGVMQPHRSPYATPTVGPFSTLFIAMLNMLLALPTVITTYRAITTPHRLPWFSPRYSLRTLFTPTERRKPWVLYLTPGLLAAQITQIAYVTLVLRSIRALLLPNIDRITDLSSPDYSPIRVGIYLGIVILSTIIVTPLEVISTRLAIQRNHASPEFNSVAQEEEGDQEEHAEYSGADEDVIGLRNEGEPYLGLVDCYRTIVAEEGYGALYRAWWLTMFGGFLGAFA